MASVGHIAVGMAAARFNSKAPRPSLASALACSALALLPDLDVVARSFGVTSASIWGHRGVTHSFVFAAAIGVLTFAIAAKGRARSRRHAHV